MRALNWDSGYEQRFIAVNPIGDEVLLYETRHEQPNIETNDIVKIGSRIGFNNIQCSEYSYYDIGLMSIGQINGTVCVFNIISDNSATIKLRPKQSRPCNALSFNHNGLLAAGFDKGRQDNSLQIWGIENLNRYNSNDNSRRPLYSYFPNEAVLSTTFCPDNENILLAGSYKFLREVDLRSDSPTFQLATKCTLGITIDPLQLNLFMSHNEEGSVSIWDRRKLTSNVGKLKALNSNVITEAPLLQFNKLLSDSTRKSYSPCVRYSTIRRGEFSALFNGDLIRRWNTGFVPLSPASSDPKVMNNSHGVLQSLKHQASQLYDPQNDSLFVSIVLDVKTDYERVISYDYSTDLISDTSTNFVCMRQSGSVFRMPVVESIESLDFNSFNEFTFAGPEGTVTKFLKEQNNQNVPEHQSDNDLENSMRENDNVFSEENEYSLEDDSVAAIYGNEVHIHNDPKDDFVPLEAILDISDVLDNDICTVIRKRAALGYGLDCGNNVALLESLDEISGQSSLRNTWKWISLAKKSLEKGIMLSEGIDLGYEGVLGIWRGMELLKYRTDNSSRLDDFAYASVVKSIVSSKAKKTDKINIPSNSEKKNQRKLCLMVSGWYFTDSEFEERLDALLSLRQYEKAAGWAVFQGDIPKAMDILTSSKDERLNLISTAIAGYLAYKDSNVNSPWKDQCRKMASDLDDPYLRAIFAFIADNDWWDVLDEHALPLRERLGVAIRFLSDKDLTTYLSRIADSVIARGELEGLILTGITPKGIELLQSYVDRSSDVQTASLMASFACPRYFRDTRVDHWTDCYRSLLNSWSMFSERARFDVARSKLSRNRMGQQTLKPAPKQIYLQCLRCNKNISKPRASGLSKPASAVTTPGTPSSANASILLKQFNKMTKSTRDYKACIHCGAPLPRCAICLLSLGAPIPLDSGLRLDDSTKKGLIENHFREWFTFCLSCNHGAHAFHAEEWFLKHYVCPVPDCNCRCNS